ncbi:MAG: transposase, partial [Gammaproteobacteria bacterium]|nr:transposase [Candidatus Bathyarchaeota archaeon]NIW11047.1 transposase [Gammaproteobacteria bacterium]
MNHQILDLYSDYLLSSFGQTTATGLSRLLDGNISHDQVTRMLASPTMTAKAWWKMVKPFVRQIEQEDGVMIMDDSIIEKQYTDENDIICWHYDHSKGVTVKGINFLTALYFSQSVALPVTFELVSKTETYLDKKTGQEKRKSAETKNERYRRMLRNTVQNRIPFKYVLNDLWFASAENMCFVKLDLEKEFIMALKSNRKVALSADDKANGIYQRIDQLDIPEGTTLTIYLEGVNFPLQLVRQVFTNEDGSTGVRYLVTSDLTLTADQLITIYQKRWKVEEYHRSLKQNAAVAKSPTRTETTQTNHFVAALWSFVKIELLSVQTKKNH